ncbi:hypothetical protein ACB092_01G083900 [Castanea dentata]
MTEPTLRKKSLGGASSSIQAGADTVAKDFEPVVPEVVVEFATDVQVVETQAGIPQTIQRVEGSLIPESGDATI